MVIVVHFVILFYFSLSIRIYIVYLPQKRRGIGYVSPSLFGGILKPKTF